MSTPLLFLLGYRTLTAERAQAAALVELCRAYGLVYRRLTFSEEQVSFCMTLPVAKRFLRLSDVRSLSVQVSEASGLPGLLLRLCHRPGLMLGSLLFCLILFASTGVLWDIRVEGNRTLSDRQVEEELRDCGFYVGCPLRGLNTAILENRVLIYSEDIAWISVNMNGTVAHVVIRELVPKPDPTETADAVNLVAKRGGEIAWLEEARGNVAVESGDRVAKGELLIGGIYAKEDGPIRYTRASGKVMARTFYQFSLSVPLSYEREVPTGEEKIEKFLIFFEKEIKFFGNTGNCLPECDTISTVEEFGLREDRLLPFGIRTVRHRPTTTETAERSEEEALALAKELLSEEMAEAVPDGVLLSKTVKTQIKDGVLTLWCEADFLEDIAQAVPIEIQS